MVIRDGESRERLWKLYGIICVEMEATGLQEEQWCLVIRGICDYADPHKNKKWRKYAAATAAAYARGFLSSIP
jgi:nucleoside phosphorylase